MDDQIIQTQGAVLAEAYTLVERALLLLDQARVPADIGAHFDHGLSRLRDLLSEFEATCA